jgi:hypothetical protein
LARLNISHDTPSVLKKPSIFSRKLVFYKGVTIALINVTIVEMAHIELKFNDL